VILENIAPKNILLFLCTVISIPLLAGKSFRKTDGLLMLLVAAYSIFLLNLSTIYDFYFLLLFPFMAVLSARGLLLIERAWGSKAAAVIILVVVLYSGWSIMKYRQHEELYFEKAVQISDFVKSTTLPAHEIFGDSTTVPLISMISGRRVALDEIDTNYQRFTSKTTNLAGLLERVGSDPNFKYFIVARKGIGPLNETIEFLGRRCRLPTTFVDRYKGKYYVFDCGK